MKKIVSLFLISFMTFFCSCSRAENVDGTSKNTSPYDTENSLQDNSDESIDERESLGEDASSSEISGGECASESEKVKVVYSGTAMIFEKSNVELTLSFGMYKENFPYDEETFFGYKAEEAKIEQCGGILLFVNHDDVGYVMPDNYLPQALYYDKALYEENFSVGKILTAEECFREEYLYEFVEGERVFQHTENFVVPEELFVEGEDELYIIWTYYGIRNDQVRGFFGAGVLLTYECADNVVTIKTCKIKSSKKA